MVSPELTALLSTCPSPETGCSASDPNVVSIMMNPGDAVIRRNLTALYDAAITAGVNGVPIEEARYHVTTITEKSLKTSNGTVNVLEKGNSDIADISRRLARCGHACGAMAVGCPVRTAPEAKPDDRPADIAPQDWPPIEYTV